MLPSQAWKKFGAADSDGPGPNPATTTVNDEIFMNFVTNKEVRVRNAIFFTFAIFPLFYLVSILIAK